MLEAKLIHNISENIDVHLDMLGAFGETDSSIDDELNDLITIAKTFKDNVLVKQLKHAENNFIDGKGDLSKALNNLVVEDK